MQTSAKTGAEVSKCFDVLTHLIMDLKALRTIDTTVFKIEPQEPEIKIDKKETEKQIKIEQILKHIRERQRVIDNTKKKKKKGL